MEKIKEKEMMRGFIMVRKSAGFKWSGRKVWEGVKGGLYVIKKGSKRYLPSDFTRAFHLRRKRKK